MSLVDVAILYCGQWYSKRILTKMVDNSKIKHSWGQSMSWRSGQMDTALEFLLQTKIMSSQKQLIHSAS